PGKLGQHLLAGLSRLNAAHPRLFMRLEFTQSRRERARRELTQRGTADAADVLYLLEPVDLGEFFRNVALAAKPTLLGNLQHGVPVYGGIVLRRCRLVRRAHGGETEHLARLAVHLR